MAQTIDSLEVVFAADMMPLSSCLDRINIQLMSVNGASDIADASLRNMAGALDFGMSGLRRDARNAGQAVGDAFAKGLRSKKGEVDAAVKYLTAAALEALRRLMNMGSGAGVNEVGSVGIEKFDAEVMRRENGEAEAAGKMDITIPLNVDGIKLGEACMRGIGSMARMTGRAILNI